MQIFFLQKSHWQSTINISFTVTPIKVIPKPTSLYHRARSGSVTFMLFCHYENDHSALAVNSPSERDLFPAIVSADSPHFFQVDPSSPGKPRQPLA
jgi:hypothetical protein